MEIPATGLSVVYDPPDPSVDIVFVHGFTGHPQRTWTHMKGDVGALQDEVNDDTPIEPLAKSRKLGPFSRPSRTTPATGQVYWPRDLLPRTIPKARVLTYGYDTRMSHRLGVASSQSTIYDHSGGFLVELASKRTEQPQRALIFVAHSLGGIIVKEMLRRSKNCETLQPDRHQIFKATKGVVFFGTPHVGADPRSHLRDIAESAIKAFGFRVNKDIMHSLLPSSERLKELRDEFGPMAQQQNWSIYSFQEDLGMAVLNNKKVVEDVSSCIGNQAIETVLHIGRDHRDMCRFTSLHDVEYQKVANGLLDIHRKAQPPLSQLSRVSPFDNTHLTSEQRNYLLDSLRFDEIDSRHLTIRSAHRKTCRWLLTEPTFLAWLDTENLPEHHGFLWIKGKPGAGKSTLMKFALASARRTMNEKTIVSFFFNARGDDLEKSTEGMYRSLLLQLLEQMPALQERFDLLGLNAKCLSRVRWSIELLKHLFELVVEGLEDNSVICFIDALDECDEFQIRDMIKHLEQLSEMAAELHHEFRICFASRYYPHISIRHCIHLDLSGQKGHNEDIRNYIENELVIGPDTSSAASIRSSLYDTASGVFLWVMLVVGILNKEYDAGHQGDKLLRKLREVPSDLHALLSDILTRDRRDVKELLLCLQWVLFARNPLTPKQLYYGILAGTCAEDLDCRDKKQLPDDLIQKRLLNDSKGLIEFTKTERPVVQFIHESVVDFLLRDGGLNILTSDPVQGTRGTGHQILAKSCLTYLRFSTSHRVIDDRRLYDDSGKKLKKRLPLLGYATDNVLWHADQAAGIGLDQSDFIQNFPRREWIKASNIIERCSLRRYTEEASLLYIMADQDFANLIRHHPPGQSCFDGENERYTCAWIAAHVARNLEAMHALRQRTLESAPPESLVHAACESYANDTLEPWYDHSFSLDLSHCIAFQVANAKDWIYLASILEAGVEEKLYDQMMYLLLDGAVRADKTLLAQHIFTANPSLVSIDDRQHLLYKAVMHDANGVIPLLIANGVDINKEFSHGDNALTGAVRSGHLATAEVLLDHGASIESIDIEGQTPLMLAVQTHCDESNMMARLLLDRGADLETRDINGQTALLYAGCSSQSLAGRNLETLLDRGANIESRDKDGRTALSCAAQIFTFPHPDGDTIATNLRILLSRGADIESKDKLGRTPLSLARSIPHMELLIDSGANIESRDDEGRTPLYWHARDLNVEAVKCLLQRGASVNTRDFSGATPLISVVRYLGSRCYGFDIMALELLVDGRNIDSFDEEGRTALMWAASSGSHEIVNWLLGRGADPFHKDLKGDDALSIVSKALELQTRPRDNDSVQSGMPDWRKQELSNCRQLLSSRWIGSNRTESS